ncbi:MAG: hypothetical protein ABIG84_05655 [archaeon]
MMNDSALRMKELLDKGWIKLWMIFEVQAADKAVCEAALKKHIRDMGSEESVEVVEKSFADIDEIDVPEGLKQRGVKVMFTQVCEVTMMAKDFEGIVNVVINYAPTAVEIMAPEKITLSMRDAQNALVSVADMMHKFARAGIGGMLIKGG